jgi:hypothetical protein
MSFPRTFELSSGLATGLFGMIVALTILKDDLDTSRRLEQEFRLFQELGVLLIFFMAPPLLVAIGSYFHVVLGQSVSGRVMIFIGSLVVTVFFLLFEINAGYAATYRIGLRSWPVVLALVTLVTSFTVRGKAPRNTDV